MEGDLMKVIGKVRVYWSEDSVGSYLKIRVKFKLPAQFFYRSKECNLASSWWIGIADGYDDENEFLKDCCYKISSKDFLERKAKELIKEYIKDNYEKIEKDLSKKKVMELLKSIDQNFKIEVEYEENK
jgi:Txe/YoeB family toxin of Txe-Axe toxin-antitoxin module